jgi:hypothetical protein
MFQIFPMMQEVKIITDTAQKSLFNLADYQIEPVPLRESIGDWDWESIGIDLLPNFKKQEQLRIERPIESKVRE